MIRQTVKRINTVFIPFLILTWMIWIPGNSELLSSYRSTNLILGIIGLIAFIYDRQKGKELPFSQKIIISLFSFAFASASILAQLTEFSLITVLEYITISLSFFGAFFSFYSVIHAILSTDFSFKTVSCKLKPSTVFWACFAIISVIDLFILFTSYYPGSLTKDSISQITQIMTGDYSNHHPFYHTMLIGLFIKFGLAVFNNINIAVALYSVFQIFVMSSIFSFVMVTLYQKKTPRALLLCSFILYAAHPANIAYSFTMWKDVLFSGTVLLFITALYRIFFEIGNKQIVNYILTYVGCFGFCLLRTNGFYSFVVTAIIFIVMFGKKHKKTAVGFGIVAICSWLMINPLLGALNVPPPDTIEHLSIPAQQIACVVANPDCKLTEDEEAFLSNIIDLEKVPDRYSWHISDPIKDLVRDKNGNEYIDEHKSEFFKLWLNIGCRYPKQYISAWVNQTKGYWNSGYNYWIFSYKFAKNDFGISSSSPVPIVKSLWDNYTSLFNGTYILPILNIFVSLGLMFWITVAAFVINLIKKNKKSAFLLVPIILIILTLFIATPVFSEFRYAYVLLVSLPFVFMTVFDKNETDSIKHQVENENSI